MGRIFLFIFNLKKILIKLNKSNQISKKKEGLKGGSFAEYLGFL